MVIRLICVICVPSTNICWFLEKNSLSKYNDTRFYLLLCHQRPGKLPEWSIGPHSKCGERVTVPGVRIPRFPPYFFINLGTDNKDLICVVRVFLYQLFQTVCNYRPQNSNIVSKWYNSSIEIDSPAILEALETISLLQKI